MKVLDIIAATLFAICAIMHFVDGNWQAGLGWTNAALWAAICAMKEGEE